MIPSLIGSLVLLDFAIRQGILEDMAKADSQIEYNTDPPESMSTVSRDIPSNGEEI
jgi:hypothetical protein